jgi:hypothetical protein
VDSPTARIDRLVSLKNGTATIDEVIDAVCELIADAEVSRSVMENCATEQNDIRIEQARQADQLRKLTIVPTPTTAESAAALVAGDVKT